MILKKTTSAYSTSFFHYFVIAESRAWLWKQGIKEKLLKKSEGPCLRETNYS